MKNWRVISLVPTYVEGPKDINSLHSDDYSDLLRIARLADENLIISLRQLLKEVVRERIERYPYPAYFIKKRRLDSFEEFEKRLDSLAPYVKGAEMYSLFAMLKKDNGITKLFDYAEQRAKTLV
jgi:hypothetical protein